jgi:phage FluMu gp28-like protein
MIQHPTRGRINFDLYPFQEKTLYQIQTHRHVIILKSRQLGISTLSAGYSLWMALFYADKEILVVATKQDTAKKLVTKVRVMYDNLPVWLRKQETTEENNKLSIRFKNGSQIVAASSASDVGRSAANSLVIIDEAAFIAGFDEKWAALQQTLSTGGDLIVLSTPNGKGNFFHKTWVGAISGENPFHPIKLHWTVHPDRDQKWRDEQDVLLGERLAGQECVSGDSIVTVKDKETGEIKRIPIMDLWEELN